MIEDRDIADLYQTFRSRHVERDDRMADIDRMYSGDWGLKDPAGQPLERIAPNLIRVAIEDTAEAASLMPTLRVTPPKATDRSKKMALGMEEIGAGYADHSRQELLIPELIMHQLGFGFGALTILPDLESRLPVFEVRNPRECYPEPELRPGNRPKRCVFAKEVYVTQLEDWQKAMLPEHMLTERGPMGGPQKLTLVEYYSDTEILHGALCPGRHVATNLHPIVFEQTKNLINVCPVVIPSRITFDHEVRGQFDEIIGTQLAWARLLAMIIDYADQSVYSDVWVKDLMGEMPWGGGGFIELGPNGDIGRVPPAVSSLNVDRDLDRMTDYMHTGGRWPKTRPGDVDQAIASAKFVEATVGMMSTVIKGLHQISARSWADAYRVAFATDKRFFPGTKTTSGTLRNQEFLREYDSSQDIDMKAKIRVEYGLGLGRDPSTSAVLMMQYQQANFISREFVQENIEGLTDVGRERIRVMTEQIDGVMMTSILARVEQDPIGGAAILPEVKRRLEQGQPITQIFEEVVAPPPAAPEDPLAGGGALPPGMPPGGATPPGGPGGPMPPPPPDPLSLMARIPMSGGPAQMGSQSQS